MSGVNHQQPTQYIKIETKYLHNVLWDVRQPVWAYRHGDKTIRAWFNDNTSYQNIKQKSVQYQVNCSSPSMPK